LSTRAVFREGHGCDGVGRALNSGQLTTGWGGYFFGSSGHRMNVDVFVWM
jgi:hypothetical protein